MNLRGLEYLVAVADHGTFGRAAVACGVSQPTLSVQVKKLEAELGVELVERGTRTAGLTIQGQQVVSYAREVLLNVAHIQQVGQATTTLLRIGVFPTLAQYLLPHVTGVVRERLPDTQVHWVERKSAKLVSLLGSGQLDAVILAAPAQLEATAVVRELFSENLLLAAPLDHEFAESTAPADLSLVTTDSLILLDDGHCLRDQVLQLCAHNASGGAHEVRASSLETLRHMVAAGMGPTLLPVLATLPPVPELPGVVLRRFKDPAPRRDIVMVWRGTSPVESALEELASCVTAGAQVALHPTR